MRAGPLCLAAVLAVSPAVALGQVAPRAEPSSVDPEVQRAVGLLIARQPEEAVQELTRVLRERGIDPMGRDVLAVLLRLANARARPGAPTAGAPPAPPTPTVEGELPPPPSDEAARALVVDAAVDRLARWDMNGADVYLRDAGTSGPDASVFEALRRVRADDGGAGSAGAPVQLVPERPVGTIAGFEVLSLYGTAGAYGFVLGTWAGLAVTDDERNAARIALPLAGIAGGVVTAALLDRSRAVRRGRGFAASAGLLLGSVAGTAAVVYAQPREPRDGWGLALLGTSVGLGVSLGLAHLTDALPGTMNYVTTAGLWGAMVGLSIGFIAEGERLRNETAGSALLIGEGVGVVLAMFSAHALQPTPSQTRWADLGACVGGMLGGSLALASQRLEGVGVGMALGILGGGTLAWFLGAPSDADRQLYLQRSASREPSLRFGMAPLPGGGMLTVGM